VSQLLDADYRPVHVGNFSLGVIAGLVNGYTQLNNGHRALAGLPYVSFATSGWKTNLFCVPHVGSAPAVCSVQFGINLGNW
jgi:hypothetical protein